MKLKDFEVEQWMNLYEHQARHNLTDSSVASLRLDDLLALEPDSFSDVVLDYGMITGDPALKAEILQLYQNQDPATLTTSQGCLQGNQMVMDTLLEPGDKVVTFVPGYQQFYDYPASLGCQVAKLPLIEETWKLDFEQLAQYLEQNPDTRLLIINNPSNPTGSQLDLSEMEKLVSLCRKYDLWLLADEVYKDPYDPTFADLYEKAVVTGSLSKLYGLAGLRFGWIKGPEELIVAINSRRDYTIISTGPLKDALAALALRHKDTLLQRGKAITASNYAAVQDWLKDNPFFYGSIPQGSTVAFLGYRGSMPSRELAARLLEETGIFFVPGACFGYENHLRLGLGQQHENLPAVLEELSRWMENQG